MTEEDSTAQVEVAEGREEVATKPVLEIVDEARRDFALKRWSAAADKFGEALEILRQEHEEDAPILAPIFHRYSHALLEHAIATSGALGGGGGTKDAPMPSRQGEQGKTVASARADKQTTDKEGEKAVSQASSSKEPTQPADPRFTFGGDAEDSEEEGEQGEAEGEAGEDEEDDLSVAFSVLELARVSFERVLQGGQGTTLTTLEGEVWDEASIKTQLAEVLNDLADVGLESENFQQASSDYEASLTLLAPLLQPHSRRLADAYLRLGLALEFHPEPSRRAESEKYVQGARNTLAKRTLALEARLRIIEVEKTGNEEEKRLAKAKEAAAELRSKKAVVETEDRLKEEGAAKGNGKGKAPLDEDAQRTEKDEIVGMDEELVQQEMKDVKEMTEELDLKLEEYKAAPRGSSSLDEAGAGAGGSDKAALQQAINDALLGASTNALSGGSSAAPTGPINDLSSMVKKKKKPAEGSQDSEESKEKDKRKAETTAEEQDTSKKTKTSEE